MKKKILSTILLCSLMLTGCSKLEKIIDILLEEETEVFIGIGVNPDLCGKHYGRRMLMRAYEISKERYPNKPLYLEVRTWNTRAVKCYERAGFKIDGEPYELTTGIGTGTFYRMTRV